MAESGQHGIASCPGYVDEHGQWNNGFFCPKWSSKPNQQYCCGTQYKRYCCTQGEKPEKVTIHPLLTSTLPSTSRPSTSVATTTTLATTQITTVATATASIASTLLENIPLVVGVSVGSFVLLVIGILLCCCLCPCCPMRRKDRSKNNITEEDKSMDGCRSERRISDFSDSTLQRPLTPSYRSESPPVPEMTVIPVCYTDTDTLTSNKGVPMTRTPQHSNYKGVVVGTVPPFVRDDPSLYPEEVLEAIKPLMYGQLCCNERNCPKCQSIRLQELCQLEMASIPHQHCMSTSVSNLHNQGYPHLKGGRYVRPVTPVLTTQSYRHYQVQNRGYIM